MTGRKKEKVMVIKPGRTDIYDTIEDASRVSGVSISIIRTAIRNGKPVRGYCFDYLLETEK